MTIPAYTVAEWNGHEVTNKGELPLWSGKGTPPAIGSVVETSGRIRHQVKITGYAVEDGWLMALGYRVAEPAKSGNLAGAEIYYPEA